MKQAAMLFATALVYSLTWAQTKPLEATVKSHNNRPAIFINNQPVSPQFYALTHAYGARWSWEENPSRNLKNFCSLGFRLFQVDLYFEDIWYKGQPRLDIAKAQKQVRGVLDVCPDAAVVIRVHVNAPFWWNEENQKSVPSMPTGRLTTAPMALQTITRTVMLTGRFVPVWLRKNGRRQLRKSW
jgi:hypothetical protein